jgi:transmembrane sensor
MDTKKAQELLQKYKQGTLNPEEKAILDGWYLQLSREENSLPDVDLETKKEAILNRLAEDINPQKTTRRLWTRIAAAASVLLVLSIGGYHFLHVQKPQQVAQLKKQDVAPGHNQATLTLANGKKIILTKGLSGQLAVQGQTAINVNSGSAIAYNNTTPLQIAVPMVYNTLETNRKERSPYPLILADGTKVWLNAASSITFPVAFTGKDRIVTITGEVYFEVAHNAAQPFRVKANGQMIEDIGTAFNVNAYSDEPVVTTTLLQGSVRVSLTDNQTSVVLKPGDQAKAANGELKLKSNVDLDGAVAWKSGIFQFKNTRIDEVLRQAARWYDVDVDYQQGIPDQTFSGKISENVNLSGLLDILSYSGVHFRIEGNKIIVNNN